MSSVTEHPVVTVALGGHHDGLTELFTVLTQHTIGDEYRLKLVEADFADELLDVAQRNAIDLFIILLNPTLRYSTASAPEHRLGDIEILNHLKSTYKKPLVVVHNGYAGYAGEAIRQAGADAVFGMPFDCREFKDALTSCRIQPPTP